MKLLLGLAGAITSMTPALSSVSPPLFASTSLDRFFRLHSTYELRGNAEASSTKGEVLAKLWVKSVAGCVAWDGKAPAPKEAIDEQDEDDQDIWARMQDVGEGNDTSTSVSGSDDEDEGRKSTTNKKKKVQQSTP